MNHSQQTGPIAHNRKSKRLVSKLKEPTMYFSQNIGQIAQFYEKNTLTKLFTYVVDFWNSSSKQYGLHWLACHASFLELEFKKCAI